MCLARCSLFLLVWVLQMVGVAQDISGSGSSSFDGLVLPSDTLDFRWASSSLPAVLRLLYATFPCTSRSGISLRVSVTRVKSTI
ncbi:hypothetical protein C8R45DRAFT_1019694 [Mycena sanguinolenta]|nr:hypothetical protein C8R45DRAFT_1019694 [Mycena sanguinolenta]